MEFKKIIHKMTFDFKKNKMLQIQKKRMEEKQAIKDHWKSQGGFKTTEDMLKDKYKRDIQAGELPF